MATLYYGDNLHVLRDRDWFPSESVDLVYLDPPFNSERDYNVLFTEHEVESEAQIRAFKDTWRWDTAAVKAYRELTGTDAESLGIPPKLVTLAESLRAVLGESDMMAYIAMMALRLVELRRVLKQTGSLYLHCDSTASHYLKMLLDAIFGIEHFKNDITWLRTVPKSDFRQGATNWPRVHDTILYYAKSNTGTYFCQAMAPYSEDGLKKYNKRDPDGRQYQLTSLNAPGAGSRGHPKYEFLGVTKYWRYSEEKMNALLKEGRIIQPSPGAVPRYKRYLDEMSGVPTGDVWTDIAPVNARANERLGYPTQKPVSLLERIIKASSNEGDVVLDPFCGCGTTIDAAQRLKRQWIGIDITHLAIALIRNRLDTSFPGIKYEVHGEPVDTSGALALAESDKYQFQWWALHLVGARPAGEAVGREGKKGMDRGIDGVIRFIDDPRAHKSRRILVSVKAGKNLNPAMVRDLRGTIEREDAPIGVLLVAYEPTREMRKEAASAGTWRSPTFDTGREYPRIQIITVAQALAGARVDYPGRDVTLQAATVAQPKQEQLALLGGVVPKAKRKK